RKGQSRGRGGAGQYLVAAICTRLEHSRHVELVGRQRQRGGERIGCERLDRIHPHGAWVSKLARQRERLPRGISRFHQDEDVHNTPAFRRTSTTAGAAVAPLPSDSARRPWPAGTASRTSSRRCAGRVGVATATGWDRARILPGTEG